MLQLSRELGCRKQCVSGFCDSRNLNILSLLRPLRLSKRCTEYELVLGRECYGMSQGDSLLSHDV